MATQPCFYWCYLWSNGEFDARGVHAALGKVRGISHNTIQSTLERLFKKKLLARKKISHAYVYQTAVARDELMGRMINDVVNAISKDNTDGMLAAFVDIAARTDDAACTPLALNISGQTENLMPEVCMLH